MPTGKGLLLAATCLLSLVTASASHAGNEAPAVCVDPLASVGGIDAEVLAILRATCPACPFIEQARYPSHGAYAACVTANAVRLAAAGILDFDSARALARAARASEVARGRPARTLLPGPGENGFDPGLATLARQYDRQFLSINAAPFSMSLDAHLADPGTRTAVTEFLADPDAGSGPEAFAQFTGIPVFDAVDFFAEVGDLGMFGGVAAAGDAFRYAVLRRRCDVEHKDCDLAEAARAQLLEILEVLHVAHAITGPDGVIARGLARRDMPLAPGTPAPIPVRDAAGNPNPECLSKPENPTLVPLPQRLLYREDVTQTVPGDPSTGQFPEWIWMDNASKDQLTGWVFAMGALYDAIRDDPRIPVSRVDRLAVDAATIARRLMRVGGPVGVDLTIIDGDGCATTYHDLHAEELQGVPVSFFLDQLIEAGGDELTPEHEATIRNFRNGFNALLALGAMRTLCHVSRAPDVCAFYYDELVDHRHWPALLLQDPIPVAELPQAVRDLIAGLDLFPADLPALGSLAVDLDEETNYSNVNMAFIAFWGLLRYEPEPDLRRLYQQALDQSLWDTGITARQPAVLHQSFFDFIYTSVGAEGSLYEVIAGGADTLGQFPEPPYFDPGVENCDAAEITAGACIAIDGSPILLAPVLGDDDAVVAVDPLTKRIRPPSNFEWRSNPYAVNGGGSNRLNPGGDFRAAYWMGRSLRRNRHGEKNLARGVIGRADHPVVDQRRRMSPAPAKISISASE